MSTSESSDTDKPESVPAGADATISNSDDHAHSDSDADIVDIEGLRRSSWSSSTEAIGKLFRVAASKDLQLRESDRTTSILLLLALLAVASLIPFPGARNAILIVVDVIFGLIIGLYLGNRLGLLTTFTDRQTAIVAQIIIGFVALSVFLVFNSIAFVGVIANLLLGPVT